MVTSRLHEELAVSVLRAVAAACTHLPPLPLSLAAISRSVAMPAVFVLCASLRRRSKPRAAEKEEQERPATATSSVAGERLNIVSGIRALVAAAALSWKRGEPAGEGRPLWKKTILMGVKCRQLEFSGMILYDSEGKQLVQELPKKTSRNYI